MFTWVYSRSSCKHLYQQNRRLESTSNISMIYSQLGIHTQNSWVILNTTKNNRFVVLSLVNLNYGTINRREYWINRIKKGTDSMIRIVLTMNSQALNRNSILKLDCSLTSSFSWSNMQSKRWNILFFLLEIYIDLAYISCRLPCSALQPVVETHVFDDIDFNALFVCVYCFSSTHYFNFLMRMLLDLKFDFKMILQF